jgi:hypothetical protein
VYVNERMKWGSCMHLSLFTLQNKKVPFGSLKDEGRKLSR